MCPSATRGRCEKERNKVATRGGEGAGGEDVEDDEDDEDEEDADNGKQVNSTT
eukprot:CAMPEP_0175174460 /NCGR_PEP_ID=MMETSP0087-20121206/32651_1 /TAXON_ID=136419 /ORGANISM="Unknown Unknown, Strain D1" /LENGTH=52 /DNA_ID=CAMNT_0016465945 /DNA_START=131 /DNA_END=289 /DNA_ORIENTATION=-